MKDTIKLEIAIGCGVLICLISFGILLKDFVIKEDIPRLPDPAPETTEKSEKGETKYNIDLEPMELMLLRCDELAPDQCGQAQYFDVPLSHELQNYIFNKCEEYDVPAALVIAIIDHESCFRTQIISEDGHDFGLMQIRDCNHSALCERCGISDYLDPFENVYAGIVMLSDAIQTAGDIPLGLMIYNNGPTKAKEKWREGVYSTPYVDKVMTLYSYYDSQIRFRSVGCN